MSGDTPTLTSVIARVVHLSAVADEYADARNEPDAVSDAAGDLGDDLRQLGGLLRRLVDEREAEHRDEVKRLTEDDTERVQDARHAMRLARIDRGVAQAEVERLTHEHSQEVLGLLSNAAAVKIQHDARVERLTANEKAAISFAGERKGEFILANLDIERLTRERDDARGWAAKWRLMGWGCVESTTYRHPFPWEPGYVHPEDSTTDEPGGDQ